MYNQPIHEPAVPKKINPMRHGLSFHPLLLGFLLEKGEKLLTKVRINKKRVDRFLNNFEDACG